MLKIFLHRLSEPVILCFWFIACVTRSASQQPATYSSGYSSSNSEHNRSIRTILEGSPIKMKCDRELLPDEEVNVTWLFYKCEGKKCAGARPRDGESLCGGANKPCKLFHKIDKATKDQSGLYSCYLVDRSHKQWDMRLVRVNVYQLTVIGTSIEKPEFVESPGNMKVMARRKIGMTCRVRSTRPIIIRWFKKLPPGAPQFPEQLNYMNNTYKELNSQLHIKENEYQSKMMINFTKESDSGTYVCGVISDLGITVKEAKLTVEPFSERKSYSQGKTEIAISLGVLITISLVTCGWIVCCCHRLLTREPTQRQPAARPSRTQPVTSDTSDYEIV